jgi:hypothetical protein
MAWRNLWRHWRRTWLTVGAMIFSNALLVFSISLQFGSYDMMIDNSLQAFSGHLQLQHPRYLDEPKMRYAVDDITELADRLRRELDLVSIGARATGFALASSTGADQRGALPRTWSNRGNRDRFGASAQPQSQARRRADLYRQRL